MSAVSGHTVFRHLAPPAERPAVKCGIGRTLLKRTSGIGKGKRAAEDAAA